MDDDEDEDEDAKPSKRARKPVSAAKSKGKAKQVEEDEEDEADDDEEDASMPTGKKVPELLLANKWDIEKGPDPSGWWISEKLDGVRFATLHYVVLWSF